MISRRGLLLGAGGVGLVGLAGWAVAPQRVERMLGLPGALPTPQPARLGGELGPNGPRAHYMRARVAADGSGWRCTPFARQDSSLLSVLVEANALLVRPPGDPARACGEEIAFLWIP